LPCAGMGIKMTVPDHIFLETYFRLKESLMRSSILGGFALGAALVALAGCATGNTPAAHPPAGGPRAPAVATRAPAAIAPGLLRPYPEGQGDTDGLSRDPDDCDRGCIGGNPD
jgi:hypothetical protein